MRRVAVRLDRAALEDPLLVAKSLQALARRRSANLGAWKGHLQRAALVVGQADAQAAARVLNACSRRIKVIVYLMMTATCCYMDNGGKGFI